MSLKRSSIEQLTSPFQRRGRQVLTARPISRETKIKRLAIVNTHPVQYQAPWFRGLAATSGLDVEVFFGHRATADDQADAGFGVGFEWDSPVLDGYPHRFLKNRARRASPNTFLGIDIPEIRRIIRQGKYQGVIVNGWHYKGAWQAITECWRTGTPVMVRGDSQLGSARSRWKRALKWAPYRSFVPRLSACLAVGTRSKEYFCHYGAHPDKVFWVPHVIDKTWFGGQREYFRSRRLELRREWDLEPEATVFLFAGKFMDNKRPLDFLTAIQRACGEAEGKLMGLMAGDGPLRGTCERLVRDAGLPVRFTGFLNQSRIVAAYVASDSLVLPSEETWGLVVNEAMFCGLPCLVSDAAGSAPDMIRPGETGFVYPFGDLGALASLMSRCSRPSSGLSKMRRGAAEMADKYSPAAAVSGVQEALSFLCGSNRANGISKPRWRL